MLKVVDKHKISVHTNPFQGLEEMKQLVELAEGGKMKGKGVVIMDSEQIEKEKASGL